MEISEEAEKILEKLWIYPEENNGELMPFDSEFHDKVSFKELENLKLVNHNEDRIYLTHEGLRQSNKIVDKNRLLNDKMIHDGSINYIVDLKPSIQDYKQIYPCECSKNGHCMCVNGHCKCSLKNIEPIKNDVKPIYGLKKGQSRKIVCIHSKKHSNLHKILSNGFLPGKEVTVIRKYPINVLRIENNTIAVGNEIANSIYVEV